MSALGQKQTFAVQPAMSALPPKADISLRTALRLPTDREWQKAYQLRPGCQRTREGRDAPYKGARSYKGGRDKRLPQNNAGELILPT